MFIFGGQTLKVYKMKIYYKSLKANNEDRKLVAFQEGMNTSKYETSFGVFTMQNESTDYKAIELSEDQTKECLKKLNANLRKGFGKYFTR